MIDRVKLTNFTVFRDCEIDFSSKINVIVGENGTGKTHLLKATYALCNWNKILQQQEIPKESDIAAQFTDSLLGAFFPTARKLADLRSRHAKAKSYLKAIFDSGRETEFSFGPSSKTATLTGKATAIPRHCSPFFIPAKEVLSFLPGIFSKESDRETVERLFDEACLDLCKQLGEKTKPFKPSELEGNPRLGTIVQKIANAIHGQFKFENSEVTFIPGHFNEKKNPRIIDSSDSGEEDESVAAPQLGSVYEPVFIPEKGDPLRGVMVAEGFRKIGVLQQMLLNRTFNPGSGGLLLWDEPEANINPALMKTLVDILLELSRNGQQIVLATHDYVLLKWIELQADPKLNQDHVKYHALSRNTEGQVEVHSTTDYLAISPNAIADTFGDLYDAEVKRSFGGKK